MTEGEAMSDRKKDRYTFRYHWKWAGLLAVLIVSSVLLLTRLTWATTGGGGGQDDHGNTRRAASSMSLFPSIISGTVGTALSGNIETGGDVDYFQLTISQSLGSGTVVVWTTGNTDTYGVLEDSSGSLDGRGRELARNDDGGNSTNFRIAHRVSPGTYYIRVTGYGGYSTGAYSILVHFTPGGGGLPNGDYNYCVDQGPCSAGEGDCDRDSECASGLTCVHDVGANYGFASDVDVCEGGGGLPNGDYNYCVDQGPCSAGEGDCDRDSECASGLTCVHDVGANYGFASDVDVCEGGGGLPNGDYNYCVDQGPCSAGEGDCDRDSECASGLTCVHDVGANYGFASDVDVCEGGGGLPNGDYNYCVDQGPCSAGEGDCDRDSECASGLTCVHDVGANYGFASDVDVCEGGGGLPNGDYNYCVDQGPCSAGEGDCDRDSECASGLTCVHDVGANYGFASDVDVCETLPSGNNVHFSHHMLEWDEGSVNILDDYTYTVTVKNSGTADVRDIEVHYYRSRNDIISSLDVYLDDGWIGTLGAGRTEEDEHSLSFSQDIGHYIGACVLSGNSSSYHECTPGIPFAPDLTVVSGGVRGVQFISEAHNIGNARADRVRLKLYRSEDDVISRNSDTLRATRDIFDINPRGSNRELWGGFAQYTNYYYYVCAETVGEIETTNNCSSVVQY